MADVQTAEELRTRSDEEILLFVRDKGDELMRLRFQYATGQLENVARMKQVKREIARAKTISTERAKGVRAKAEG